LKILNKQLLIMTFSLVFVLSACVTSPSATKAQKRAAVLEMQQEVLNELYESKPSVRAQIAGAAGYAVFDNANVNLILASFGGGYGIVKNNLDNQVTYMKMAEAGIGFGAGVKDFHLIMVFHDQSALKQFVDSGWAFGAQADAAAKAGKKGGALGGEATVDNITIYQITKAGIALQATIKGTKFWQDDELN
jgi:lipid-binding SYLF domain-containing protein